MGQCEQESGPLNRNVDDYKGFLTMTSQGCPKCEIRSASSPSKRCSQRNPHPFNNVRPKNTAHRRPRRSHLPAPGPRQASRAAPQTVGDRARFPRHTTASDGLAAFTSRTAWTDTGAGGPRSKIFLPPIPPNVFSPTYLMVGLLDPGKLITFPSRRSPLLLPCAQQSAIVPEEKALIRRRLLTPFDEERKELSVTNAVLTSKIARLDFPQEWPDLLQSLLTVIQTTTASADSNAHSRLVQVRALYTLHMVVKALCSQRLAPSRRHLEQVSPELFRQIATIYVGHVDRFLAGLQNSSDLALVLSQMEVSVVCLKCIRRLMVHGFDDFSKVEETRQFFTLTLVHLQRFYALRKSPFPLSSQPTSCHIPFTHSSILPAGPAFLDTPIATPLDSHIIKLGKLYLDLQKYHPLPFVLAPRATDVVAFYWGVLAEEGNRVGARLTTEQPLHPPLFERFLVHGLLLLKNTIKNFSYTAEKGGLSPSPFFPSPFPRGSPPSHPPPPRSFFYTASPEEASTVSRARQVIDQSLLTPGFVNSCAEVLVSRYMVLRPEDLEAWETDPEGFVGGEEADHWEFELRPCAEKVFMDLLSQYRVQLSPILLNLLENVATITDHAGLLFKDAVYCAIGLGAHELFDSLDFDAFLVKRLTVEAWNKDPSLKILRRRIAWIIGKWVGVKISKSARPDVYRVMLRLMSAEEDTVVRLTAVNNLKNCVDDWDFEATPFAPFLKEAVYGIIGMLGDVSEFDSRMRILNSLSMIIERVEEQIAPYAQQIVELLPSLWNTSESEHLFKSAILVTLTKLVGVSGRVVVTALIGGFLERINRRCCNYRLQSLKERSSNLQNFVVPLIQHSVDHNQVLYASTRSRTCPIPQHNPQALRCPHFIGGSPIPNGRRAGPVVDGGTKRDALQRALVRARSRRRRAARIRNREP
ncbi:armadillo-type protein [Jimgerdemannia flammicorona]|uniref:Armadillo-type protein n=1 Tax=Jimgerdemannia flammicorona TaxID=994334 RepID=A0A433CW95_9FUNG|nr:armadillo-type protein [Jimgerdemannia flammicorona]